MGKFISWNVCRQLGLNCLFRELHNEGETSLIGLERHKKQWRSISWERALIDSPQKYKFYSITSSWLLLVFHYLVVFIANIQISSNSESLLKQPVHMFPQLIFFASLDFLLIAQWSRFYLSGFKTGLIFFIWMTIMLMITSIF